MGDLGFRVSGFRVLVCRVLGYRFRVLVFRVFGIRVSGGWSRGCRAWSACRPIGCRAWSAGRGSMDGVADELRRGREALDAKHERRCREEELRSARARYLREVAQEV